MTQWTRECIAFAADGQIVNDGTVDVFSGFSIDTRKITADQVYIAIRGEQYDGHSFVQEAASLGVRGFIIEKRQQPELENFIVEQDLYCVTVDDTRYALGQIARFHRRSLDAKVLAITGSAGKTSTRKMVSAVLSATYKLWSTEGNFNNEIGLPLTILGLTAAHDWAVVEMGANHPGEIKRLCEIAEPKIAIITNIGPAHLEGFHTLEGVRDAKAEILSNLPQKEGGAILNGDDPMLQSLALWHVNQVVRYGFNYDNDVVGSEFFPLQSGSNFKVKTPTDSFEVTLKMPGRFMAQNALAAISAGMLLDVPSEKMVQALAEFNGADKRLQISESKKGVMVIDDSYNSNPLSMTAAMAVLAGIGAARKILVMGSMGELGDASARLHTEIGELASDYAFDRMYLCGDFTEYVMRGAVKNGMSQSRIVWGSKEYVLERLLENVTSGDCVLIKGSRSMHMEDFAEALLKQES